MNDAMLPSLIAIRKTWRGVIMARWAVGFALLMAVVLALSYGYHLGAAYIDHVVAR